MRNIRLPRLFQPFECTDLIRLGKDHDGGYLVNKHDISITKSLLSFGIDIDWTFEKDFLSINDCDLAAYDESVNDEKLKEKQLYEDFHRFFAGKNVYVRENVNKHNLSSILKHKNTFLKCDIEGNEYEILDQLIECSNLFTGMIIEVHDIHDLYKLNLVADFVSKIKLRLVHVHVNTYNYIYYKDNDFFVPNVIELSFTSSSNISLNRNIKFPHKLDMSNNPLEEDFQLVFG